jgi:hypothetical protein
MRYEQRSTKRQPTIVGSWLDKESAKWRFLKYLTVRNRIHRYSASDHQVGHPRLTM